MLPHPLTYFKIQRTYQNEPKLNGLYSKNSLPKIKDGAYVINLDEIKKTIGTHWIILYVNGSNIIYIHRFGVEHVSKIIITNKYAITKM